MEHAETIQALAFKFKKNVGTKAKSQEEMRVVPLFRELVALL